MSVAVAKDGLSTKVSHDLRICDLRFLLGFFFITGLGESLSVG